MIPHRHSQKTGGARGRVVEDGGCRGHDLAEGEDGRLGLGGHVGREVARAGVGAGIVRGQRAGDGLDPLASVAQGPCIDTGEPASVSARQPRNQQPTKGASGAHHWWAVGPRAACLDSTNTGNIFFWTACEVQALPGHHISSAPTHTQTVVHEEWCRNCPAKWTS